MPDITMCVATDCPKAVGCMRSVESGTVPNTSWQCWTNFKKHSEECGYFLDNTKALSK